MAAGVFVASDPVAMTTTTPSMPSAAAQLKRAWHRVLGHHCVPARLPALSHSVPLLLHFVRVMIRFDVCQGASAGGPAIFMCGLVLAPAPLRVCQRERSPDTDWPLATR